MPCSLTAVVRRLLGYLLAGQPALAASPGRTPMAAGPGRTPRQRRLPTMLQRSPRCPAKTWRGAPPLHGFGDAISDITCTEATQNHEEACSIVSNPPSWT